MILKMTDFELYKQHNPVSSIENCCKCDVCQHVMACMEELNVELGRQEEEAIRAAERLESN